MAQDLRKYAKTTTFRLILGGLILVTILGPGLIYLIYGPGAALTGLLCILGGLFPLVTIAGFLFLIEKIAAKAND